MVDISDSLSERDKVKFTVHTKVIIVLLCLVKSVDIIATLHLCLHKFILSFVFLSAPLSLSLSLSLFSSIAFHNCRSVGAIAVLSFFLSDMMMILDSLIPSGGHSLIVSSFEARNIDVLSKSVLIH